MFSGGSQVLSNAMEADIDKNPQVKQPVKKKRVVSSLRMVPGGTPNETKAISVKYTIPSPDGSLVEGEAEYDHVISTIPLPTLRTLDTEEAGLNFEQKLAIRTLQYGPATKIGIKFKTAWWLDPKLQIVGGQSFSDRFVRTVVYPSYGLPGTTDPTTVLIASYCWGQDAIRQGALIDGGKEADVRLVDLVLKDLAAIHGVSYLTLKDEYVDHFGFNWNSDPLTQGELTVGADTKSHSRCHRRVCTLWTWRVLHGVQSTLAARGKREASLRQ